MTQPSNILTDEQVGIGAAPAAVEASSAPVKALTDADVGIEAPSRGFKGWARDVAATAVKGAIGVPEAIVGLADIPTGGRVGKFLENEGGSVGFRPKEAKELVNDWHSDATKEAQRKFQQADGIGGKFMAAVENPSNIVTAVGESLPSMGLGGVAARGFMAARGALAARGAAQAGLGEAAAVKVAEQAAAKFAPYAGAAGEGVTMAGSAAEQIRQETPDGLLTPGQSALAGATGLVGGALGAVGGRVAQKLGIGDVDTMIAQGGKGMADEAGAAVRAASNPLVLQQAVKGIPRRVIEGAISEGFLEELPQSVAEQVFQNVALGKDWLQDVDAAAVMGVLSGGLMGGAASGYHGMRQPQAGEDAQNVQPAGGQPPGAPAQPANPGMERMRQAMADQLAALQQQEQGEPAVPQTTPPDGAAILAQQQAETAARRQAAQEASRSVAEPDDEILQSTGADAPPSVRMGIDPAAGPLSAGAALAVDTGVSGQMQQAAAQAQAAERAAKESKKPAADDQKQERQTQAQQALDPETGEILQGSSMAAWSDGDLSSAFRGAQSRDVRMQLARELSRRRAEREQQALQVELDAEQSGTVPGAERADAAFASLSEDAGPVPADLSIPTTIKGNTDVPQAAQAQQARPQPPQAGATPSVAGAASDAQGSAGPQSAPPAGVADGSTTTANHGAQGTAAFGAQAQAQSGKTEALRQQLRDVEAKILKAAPEAMGHGGGDIEAAMKSRKVPVTLKAQRKKLASQIQAAHADEVQTFAPETGTLGIPRADMPQVPAQSHGGLVKHLNAQGIAHETTTVNAADLKPTQAEYSPAKVEAAKTATGDRAVIVSSDGHVIDGHHQAMAAAEDDKPVKAIVLDAPVEQALEAVKKSPSAQGATQDAPPAAAAPAAKKPRGVLAKKAEAEAKARADYFTPGNIVKGYSGHDRVVSYTPPDADGRWSVTVRAVEKQGDAWVDKARERERTHATPPDARELKAGPVMRAAPTQQDESVQGAIAGSAARTEQVASPPTTSTNAPETIAADANAQSADGQNSSDSQAVQQQERPPASGPRQNEKQKPTAASQEQAQAAIESGANSAVPRAPRSAAPRSTPARIEDFGETLHGARKMLYAEAYADGMAKAKELDTKAHPLSKTWPEPDYQKLLEGGAPVEAVSLARALREAVPTKPQSSWKLKGWATKVEALRGFSEDVLSGRLDTKTVEGSMERSGLRGVPNKAALYEAMGHEQSLKGLELSAAQYSMYDGVRYDPARTIWTVAREAKGSAFGNWPRELAKGDTREAAIAAFKKRAADLLAEEQAPTKGATFEIYSKRAGGAREFFIGKKIGRNVSELKAGFADLKAARQYKADHQSELEDLLAKYKAVPPVRNTQNAPRIGEDYRKGADVTPDRFQEAFGFRGVQFGNYVESGRRQQDLNRAYDALMDLAGVLGLPPRALSLGGRLGLAFGARGTGGTDAAAAHYEPGTVVINLTNREGAGSLAHEWWHGLDNYFGKQRDARGEYGNPSTYLTETAAMKDAHHGGMRAEMMAAFRNVVSAINLTGMQERSRKLDDRRTKEYWTTKPEMSARAFESYVIAKLQDQNAGNDYLANIVDASVFALEDAYPYPTAGELPQIREAFDGFFQAVETKEEGAGNVVLFSRATDSVPQSIAEWLPDTVIADEVEKRIGGFAQQPTILIRDTAFGQLPGVARNDNVAGAVHDGAIYLFRDQLGDRAAVQRTLFHELFHYGLRKFLTKEQFTGQMMDLYRRDKAIKDEADRWAATVDGLRAEEFGGREYALARGVDEALAILAEPNGGPHLNKTARAMFVRRVTLWLADVAQFLKMDKAAAYLRSLHNLEARAYIQSVFKRLESDAGRVGADWSESGGPAFSRASTADMPADGSAAGAGFNVDGFLSTMARSEASIRAAGTTDRAVMDMVREGKPARYILRLVAGTSKSRFNRQVARLLLKSGITPTVQLEHGDLGSDGGFKFLGKYSRKFDTVTMTPGAELQAEHIVMHELMHAATLRALDRKGLASLQMRRLYEHVKRQGDATGHYGMKNVGEFVAEAFTNPEFQRELRSISAPTGSTLKTAWDGFVRILRSILGLPQDAHDALSQALEVGVAVMREDMALRQRGAQQRQAGDAFVQSPQTRVTYEGRIDTLFNGGKAQVGTAVLDRSDVMGLLGHPDVPLMLNERHLLDGLTNHPEMTAAAWKKVPGWLENPAMVYSDPRDTGRLVVIAPESLAGYPVMLVVEPAPTPADRGKAAPFQLLVTAYAKTGRKIPAPGFLAASGNLLYLDTKNAPEVLRRAGVQFPGQAALQRGRKKILTEKHLNGWRKANLETEGKGADGDDAYFGAADLGKLKVGALDQLHQSLSHPGKVSLWDKTVGTMRHLAERSPAFKPVYESAQRFIDDVSMLGNDAADRAPRLLPRVETLADLKKKPITAADNKAVGKPLFEGTLLWARDVDGTPVTTQALNAKYRNATADEKAQILLRTGLIQEGPLKKWRGLPVDQFNSIINNKFESTILKPGVVWSQKELKDLFGLSDQQVGLYQEARSAIDRSIDMTARADMLRTLGEAYAPMREAVLEQASMEDAMKLLTDTMQADARENPDQADRLMALNNAVVNSYERAKGLQDAGYAPLSRFGRYTVDVVSQDGTREYFGMFETMRDANLMAERMRGEFKGAAVTQGTMSDEAYKLFAGITPESLEQFGEMLGLKTDGDTAQDKAFQAYLQLSKNNHSALKRLIHRKGITGYSEDVGRVLASFVYSNARLAAGGLNAGTLETAIENIPKEQGELRDVAMGLRSYIQDPQEEGQAVRGMLFAQYLGGSVASAMVNMTQPFQITMPWLSQFGGMRKAAGQMARALKDMGTKGFKYEPDLEKALQNAVDDGTVSPQEIHQLMAQARGAGSLRTGDGTRMGDARAAVANNWERTKVAWGQPFALAEQFNRRSTFIAAYRMAKEQGMPAPAEFARRAVQETQFVYSKANKMRWGRGAIGGTMMTFKTYSVSYLELMHRMWTQGGPEGKRAVGWAVAMLMLMGGAGGLPFMEDAEDLIDGAGQLMGYNVSTKQWRKQLLRDTIGKELGDFVEQGVSGLPGAPIDVSGRLGMGNLVPGTGLLLSKQNRERDLMEVVGPAGDLVARGFTGARKALTGDLAGAALEVSPTAVRNAAKGLDMATSGIYKDTKGYKVIDTTLDEAIAKAIGFQPRSVAEVQESNSFMQRSKSFYIQTSSDIKAQWAQALFNKDDAALERVRERLADWNRDNPDQPIVVKMPDVWKRVREMGKDRTQRIADTAPKALRNQMREMARENG